jgi:hypothetical protein
MNVMPEAYRLRMFYWQLFVTLTFHKPPKTRASSLGLVFAWLRDVVRAERIHFRRLMWVLRFEIGLKGGRGHYHLCLAGLPGASLCGELCRSLESVWRAHSKGMAQVALYDPARDGVGYILKLPRFVQGLAFGRRTVGESAAMPTSLCSRTHLSKR